MAGAPKGNQNARKHGLYARRARAVEIIPSSGLASTLSAQGGPGEGGEPLRSPLRAIRYLEEVMDEIMRRMREADREEFTRLANALSLASTALFNGHRTVAYLTGGISPVEEALRELQALDFTED